jgi:multidrug resistance efflux pump
VTALTGRADEDRGRFPQHADSFFIRPAYGWRTVSIEKDLTIAAIGYDDERENSRMTSRVSSDATTLPALKLVQSSLVARRMARALGVLIVVSIVAMAFLPWQQSARGTGKVVAYVPQERQQTVTSPTKGVVERLADGLVEGARVKRGDFIVEIQPTAANLADQLNAQMRDLQTKLVTAEVKIQVYEQNIQDFAAARDFAVKAAQEMVEGAQAKRQAKQDVIPGYEAKEWQTRVNYERQRGLFEKGIKPEREVEIFQTQWDVAKAELDAARREVSAAENEVEAKKYELEQKRREAQTKVEYARAMREDAAGQAASTQKEKRELEIKLGELDRLTIEAPRDGTIFRLPIYERGQAVKEGDELFTLVPDSTDHAVELWVSGNDTPLVRPGDHVPAAIRGLARFAVRGLAFGGRRHVRRRGGGDRCDRRRDREIPFADPAGRG